MTNIGIGMIGSGFMGLTYSEVVANHAQGSKLVAVTGGRRAAQLAADYGVAAEPDVEALVARPDVDAVVIATPDQDRLKITRLAAAAGKHVLAEKPMAPTVAECDAMIAACNAANVKLSVVKTERYRKITMKAKSLIDDGTLGPVQMLRTVSAFPLSLSKQLFAERQWMSDPKSGGLFMGMASHNTDFLRWLTGKNATKVFAQATTYSDIPGPPLSIMAHITFEGGIMAQMWITGELADPSLPSSEVRFQAFGRDAMFDLENFEYLDLGKGDKWERIYTPRAFRLPQGTQIPHPPLPPHRRHPGVHRLHPRRPPLQSRRSRRPRRRRNLRSLPHLRPHRRSRQPPPLNS